MYLNYLTFLLIILVVFDYFCLFNKKLSTPALLFNLGFCLCSIFLLHFADLWNVELSYETFILVASGNISVCFSSLIVSLFFNKKKLCCKDNKINLCVISLNKIKFFLLLQIIDAFIKCRLLMNFYGTSSVSQALFMHTLALKFDGDVMQYPIGLGFISSTIEIASTIVPGLCAFYVNNSQISTKVKIWMVINFIFALAFSFLSSGRMSSLYMLIAFCTVYSLSFYSRKRRFPIRKIFNYLLLVIVFLFSFQYVGELIGRDKSDVTPDIVVGVYCGAELINLDDLILENNYIPDNELWGNQTFYSFYNTLKNYDLVSLKIPYSEFIPFNEAGGYGIGNVASAFQNYYFDFGLFGAIIVCFFLGGISEFIHQKTLSSCFFRNGIIDSWVVLYILLIPAMFLSFFAEQFFNQLSNIISLKFWVKLIIIYIIFYSRKPPLFYIRPKI